MVETLKVMRVSGFLAFQILLLFAVVLVYSPGLHGPFVFDDFPNIVENAKLHIDTVSLQSLYSAAFSTNTGPLARPIPMASFALNYAWGGLKEFDFKLVNVIIHFVNGLLVFWVARKLLVLSKVSPRQRDVELGALVASAGWLFHPLNLTSVLYVVQRMVELSTTFGLLCLITYFWGRERERVGTMVFAHSISAIFLLLALLCKENMIILVPLIAWLEWVLYRFSCHSLAYSRFLRGALLTACAVIVGYVIYNFPSFQSGYNFRPFTMSERLLTQARVLFFYLGQIFIPNIGNMHLFHDEISVSRSVWNPVTTLFSLVGVVGLIWVAIWARRRFVMLSIAIGWFLIGHLVESTFISLELVHNHRNYFPMIGICIFFGMSFSAAQKSRAAVANVLAVVLILMLAGLSYVRAHDWGSWEVLVVTEAEKNPGSTRSQYEAGRYYFWLVERDGKERYKQENLEKAVFYFERGAAIESTSLSNLAALLRLVDLVGAEAKDEWKQAILDRIGRMRPSPNDVNKVGDLYSCRIEKKCTIDTRFLSQIAAAAVNNKNLPAFAQAAIASAASGVALVEGRGDFAVYYAMVALERSPQTFEFVLNAMKIARIYRDQDLAKMLNQDYVPRLALPEHRARLEAEYQAFLND